MAVNVSMNESTEFPLLSGGIANRISNRFSQSPPKIAHRLWKVGLLIAVTWLPLLFFAALSQTAIEGRVKVPILHDPIVYSRFLFVLPLLELAEAIVALSLIVQVKHFVDSGIVPEEQRTRFEAAKTEAVQWASSQTAEIGILFLAYGLSLTMRLMVFGGEDSSWERQGTTVLPAGWWYILVSLPLLFFFLLRWLWIFMLWGWFLFRVSRLDLELTPTHPDHAGGLGFLGWGLASFSTILMAISGVFSAGFAYEILHRSVSLESLKYHVAIFIIIALIAIHLPLVSFSGRLSRCRFKGLLDYSTLVLHHDRAFDEKWVNVAGGRRPEELLGTADVQSLADIATAYDHVDSMWLLPVDFKALCVIVAASLLPMIPLLATTIPLKEILLKLGELMV